MDDSQKEMQRLVRLLQGLVRTARDASLTGQLAGGKSVAIKNYNLIVRRLSALEALPSGVFEPLDESASFDEVGVAASQLADYLRDEEEEEPRRRWRGGGGVFEVSPGHVKIVGFPGNIGELGELLRAHLPDFIREQVTIGLGVCEPPARERQKGAGPTPPPTAPPPPEGPPPAPARTADTPPVAPVPPVPTVRGETVREPHAGTGSTAPDPEGQRVRLQQEFNRISRRIGEANNEMRDPNLAPERLVRLAQEVGQLAARSAVIGAELQAAERMAAG